MPHSATVSPVRHPCQLVFTSLLILLLAGCGSSSSDDEEPEIESEPVSRVTIHDETIDGDLIFSALSDFGQLEEGKYLVSGQATWVGCSIAPATLVCLGDLDAYEFSIPADMVLDVKIRAMIEYVMSPTQAAGITQLGILWRSNTVDRTWSTESVGVWKVQTIRNLKQVGGTENLFQTPTWSLTYAGPKLQDDEKIVMHYKVVMHVRPTPLPGE